MISQIAECTVSYIIIVFYSEFRKIYLRGLFLHTSLESGGIAYSKESMYNLIITERIS